jgi:acyl carrier protein
MFRKIQSVFSKAKKAENREGRYSTGVDDLNSVEQRIKNIMAKVLKIDICDIDEETTADSIDRWNSLAHVDLLVNLQKAFDAEFTDSQLVEMVSYNTIVRYVTAAVEAKSEN